MSLWILLWLALSAIILGASGWSAYILYRQKETWRAFAAKHKFTYTAGKMMGPPSLEGFIDKYGVSFFTAERQAPDVRDRRFVTVVEITCPEGFIEAAVAGTSEMVPFMESLPNLSPMLAEMDPATKEKWDDKNRIFARNRDAVRLYLTPERMTHLAALLGTRNADVIVLFDDTQALVRLETSDPILDADKAEKVIKRLILHAQGMRITKQERAEIKERAKADEETGETEEQEQDAPVVPPAPSDTPPEA